ncbi:MAG: hypothetical protein A2144_13345 [Chloroflexi bacterium RBG_16_50_9]|nr:MAG: hypothetical protein A2144_13345 [Chloroflexi bacterium RBG_16_50_9]
MIKHKAKWLPVIATIFLIFFLAGCVGGIPQEQYQGLAAQLAKAKEQLDWSQDEVTGLRAQNDAEKAELKTAQQRIAELEAQARGLKEHYELVGATSAETAERIVRYYHETHIYSTYDLFVCSDMSSEVWNMLKAQGIRAIIAVGNKDTAISDIIQSDHAWVLAEVTPGAYLALETTGGYSVSSGQNPLYYRGWSFDSPAKLKAHNQLVNEYNVRVGIHNEMVAEDNEVIKKHNQSTSQIEADKLEAVHHSLVALIKNQEAELNGIMSKIKDLLPGYNKS